MFVSRLVPRLVAVMTLYVTIRIVKRFRRRCEMLYHTKVCHTQFDSNVCNFLLGCTDHILVSFPANDEVLAGGPGIGLAKVELVLVHARMNDHWKLTKWHVHF